MYQRNKPVYTFYNLCCILNLTLYVYLVIPSFGVCFTISSPRTHQNVSRCPVYCPPPSSLPLPLEVLYWFSIVRGLPPKRTDLLMYLSRSHEVSCFLRRMFSFCNLELIQKTQFRANSKQPSKQGHNSESCFISHLDITYTSFNCAF